MTESQKPTLPKVERLNSRILIEKLFTGGSKSLPAFPLRIVYMPVEGETLPIATILISVPKKRFKRAVKRNRVKRQIREAYRKHKQILIDPLKNSNKKVALAFIWLDNELHDSAEVEAKVVKLLQLTAERLV
ncbi:ribonuclease P protein component [Bacteroides mediterraneensis]|uniref:Ribonuclease P protein component n=1 Tax=Bacteroides mediterraneensis TaxID=1841856 RepID=A0ABS2EUP4_9BACE|nr:ribonuclease P protein component [Bacteroides mediterraneensis]MBM6758357.1 ribonuclease P protein component [Bacteroides mediterraneensis]